MTEVPRHALYVGRETGEPDPVPAYRAAGFAVLDVDLGATTDRDAVVQAFATQLRFPYPVKGYDSLVDLVSDLEWVGPEGPRLLLITPSGDPAAMRELIGIVPAVLDRWRSRALPFVIVVGATTQDDELVAAAEAGNAQLLDAYSRPWMAGTFEPVPVIRASSSAS